MAGQVNATPGFDLQPSASQVPLSTNYITNFDFLNQYLPDTYEKEFERYGNRTISSFLRMVGAEMPSNSDLIKWAEQGRLHTKYVNCLSTGAAADDTATIGVNDTLVPANQAAGQASQIAVRVGQTVMVIGNAGGGSNKAIVTAVNTAAGTFDVAYYEAGGQAFGAAEVCTVFIYGSEFKKGTNGMQGSLEAEDVIFENSPIIIKDKYSVSGSDMAQIGWIEVTTENGASGYLWYLKSEHEARLRFEDQLEMAMIEAVKDAQTASGSAGGAGFKGSEGLFAAIEDRGMIYNDANFGASGGAGLAEFDNILAELDKQGAIEENMLFLDRATSLSIDNMLAAQNSYGTGGTSYGVFNNSEDMALNLGFSGFRRGSYDFYKTDWKYLNDSTTRGLIDDIDGIIVPTGTSTVYDQNLGKNIARPFLHVRYRASEADDRKMKSWITGSVGGNYTSAADEMNVHFLSERALCVQAANNFVLLKSTQV